MRFHNQIALKTRANHTLAFMAKLGRVRAVSSSRSAVEADGTLDIERQRANHTMIVET